MENRLCTSLYMYSDVSAGKIASARLLGQRVIAFVILIDTDKLGSTRVVPFCAVLISTTLIFPHLLSNVQLSHFRIFANLIKWKALLQHLLNLHFLYSVWGWTSFLRLQDNAFRILWIICSCSLSFFYWPVKSALLICRGSLYKEINLLFTANSFFPAYHLSFEFDYGVLFQIRWKCFTWI